MVIGTTDKGNEVDNGTSSSVTPESGHTDDINADDVTPIHSHSTEIHAVDSQATTTKEGPSKGGEGTHGRFYILRTCTESVGPSARHS